MKRATRLVFPARFDQRNTGVYDIDNVNSGKKFLNEICWNGAWHKRLPKVKWASNCLVHAVAIVAEESECKLSLQTPKSEIRELIR